MELNYLLVKIKLSIYNLCVYTRYEIPAVKTMKFYFERSEKGFRGRPRESIVTTLNKDITRARSMNREFEIQSLKTKEDFKYIRSKAQDRKDWRRISEIVCKAAEAEAT